MTAWFHSPRTRGFKFGIIALILIAGLAITASPHSAFAQDGAEAIAFGDNKLGNVVGPEGVSYVLTGVAGDVADIQVLGFEFAPTLAVLDASRTTTLASNGNAAGETSVGLQFALPTDGQYVILVQGLNGGTGQFALGLTRGQRQLPPPVPLEPGQPIPGTISDPNVPAVFSFATNPDGILSLTIQSMTPGYTPIISVQTESGETIYSANNPRIVGTTIFFAPGEENLILIIDQGDFEGEVSFDLGLESEATDTTAAPPPTTQPTAEPVDDGEPPIVGSTEAPAGCAVFSGNTRVNIRAGAAGDQPIVAVLELASYIPAVGFNTANDGWYEVALPDGRTGWIASFVVSTAGDCSNLTTTDATPATVATATATPILTDGTATGPTATPILDTTTEPTAPGATQTGPTATSTATVQGQVAATPTHTFTPTATVQQQATPTYTPSYTPTTPPAAQIAPDDPRFNNPLNIPLDNTASVLDFVSYPGGDNEDRVRWDITGMNSNASLSGGRARLVISVSCFGEGIEHIQFFTGGQTYACGQTIVDQEVTFDSKTGSVVITAVGGSGTYVQWVLTGTATRVN